MKKNIIKLIILLVSLELIFFLFFTLPVIIWGANKIVNNEKRGCIVSAQQAAYKGFDLEDNLAYCDQL